MAACSRSDLAEPNLSPVQKITAVTPPERKARAVAENVLQHYGVSKVLHLSGAFSNEIVSPISHTELLAAERPLVGTEMQPTIAATFI